MTAPEGLREEIAQGIRDRINARPVWTAERLADALLAGPLAPLLDRAAKAEAAVERVRALADNRPWPSVIAGTDVVFLADLLNALDEP